MANLLATVGGMPITTEDVDAFLQEMGQRGQSYNTKEGRRAILNQLIGNKLLLLDARRNLYEAEPAFRAELARVKDTLLVNYAAEKAVAGVSVTEEEVKQYYEDNRDRLGGGETVNASHILVDSEARAREIYDEIAAGTLTFEEAARQYSSCPSSAEGGSLGDFTRGQMVPEFDTAVFAMQEGEITSQPVKTQFGYHLIRLNSKKTAEVPPYEEVKAGLYSMVRSEKQRKAYESKINQLKILYPVTTEGTIG